MTTSGTTTFNPSIGELTLYAYGLCGIRRTQIIQEHLQDASLAANLMLAEWNNETPNLWKVDLVSVPLVQGTATYSVDPSTIMMLDVYIRINSGQTDQSDRIIWPISRTEYASQPNKSSQGLPTTFWFDRLNSPSFTLWMVPDGQGPYTLQYYRVSQIYDASLVGGQTVDLPNRWLPSFAWGLAARLAVTYAPDKAVALMAMADKVLAQAREQDVENVNFYVMPTIGSYFVR